MRDIFWKRKEQGDHSNLVQELQLFQVTYLLSPPFIEVQAYLFEGTKYRIRLGAFFFGGGGGVTKILWPKKNTERPHGARRTMFCFLFKFSVLTCSMNLRLADEV